MSFPLSGLGSGTPAPAPANGADPAAPANGDGGSAGGAGEPPAWAKALQESFTKLASNTDKRFEGIAEKLRIRAPAGDATTAPPAANAGGAVTQGDLDAIIRFGELRAALPEAQRQQLEALRSDGLGFAQLARIAEGFRTALPAPTQPANGGGVVPPGVAANAPPSSALRFPTSEAELLKLRDTNPAAYEAVWAHPDFDAAALKRGR
ncbi:MAG: hypothetical protein IPG45_05955 [Deltaproteobacteria bacterium]|nr:hypothetical protein [Deltaproteobacteria bacterium]